MTSRTSLAFPTHYDLANFHKPWFYSWLPQNCGSLVTDFVSRQSHILTLVKDYWPALHSRNLPWDRGPAKEKVSCAISVQTQLKFSYKKLSKLHELQNNHVSQFAFRDIWTLYHVGPRRSQMYRGANKGWAHQPRTWKRLISCTLSWLSNPCNDGIM